MDLLHPVLVLLHPVLILLCPVLILLHPVLCLLCPVLRFLRPVLRPYVYGQSRVESGVVAHMRKARSPAVWRRLLPSGVVTTRGLDGSRAA